MCFHKVAAGRCDSDGGSLGGEDDLVNVLLRWREATIDRKSAGDVGSVALHFAAGVDQHQRVIVQGLVVLDVMQHAGVGAAGDDGRVGVAVGAAFAKFVGQFGFQLVFGHARAAGVHGAGVPGAGDVGGALHGGQFGVVLEQAHGIEFGAQIMDRARRPLAGAGLGADFVQGPGDARIPGVVVADGVPQRVAVDQQFGQFFVQLFDRIGRVEAKGTSGRFRAVAVAVPDFAFFVLVAAEQDGLWFPAADQNDHRFRLREARQVPEVAVETVGIVRVAVAHDLRCRRDDGDAVAYGLEQASAAGDEVGVVHAVLSSRSSSASRCGVPTSTQRPA